MKPWTALCAFALGCTGSPAPPVTTHETATGTRAKGEEGSLADAPEFGMLGILGDAHGSGSGHGRARASTPAPEHAAVRTGEWDDNRAIGEFRRLLASTQQPIDSLDVSIRRVLVARDAARKPLASCPITVADAQGNTITLRTTSSGRALLFPRAEHLAGALTATVRCGGNAATAAFETEAEDAVVRLDGLEPRDAPETTIDVAFALDTTASMSEEIVALKTTLAAVMARAANVRVGLVEYKDRTDAFTTRVHPMSRDLQRLSTSLAALTASGGGDLPEAMNVGLHDALTKLEWNGAAPARLLFVIGDAPPHARDPGPSYADSARIAAHAGIQIFAVAASGMDEFGQIVFRQISQFTGGTEMFVLRGGAGAMSTGGGDPVKSDGTTQKRYRSANLDALVLEKIDYARKALDEDPLR